MDLTRETLLRWDTMQEIVLGCPKLYLRLPQFFGGLYNYNVVREEKKIETEVALD